MLTGLERVNWYLWHGNVFQALQGLQGLQLDLDAAAFETQDERPQKLLKGVEELHPCAKRNQAFVPSYGERYPTGKKSPPGSWNRRSIKW